MSDRTATRRLLRALAWLEDLAGTRRGAVVLFFVALAAYAVRAVAWPAIGGRDLDEYLYAYIQLFDRDPLLPWSMLFRTPLTPVVAGLSLEVGGGILVEPLLATLYALSIVAWSAVALSFGHRAAVVTAAALLLYQGYALMFHELSSEPVLAAAFAGWALALTRAARHPTVARFALAGLAGAVATHARPGTIVLLVFVLFPLIVPGDWRSRLRWAGAFAAAAVLPLAAWAIHNGVRFDEYTLARGGNAVIPFYRAFITDHIVSPTNGDDSRRLAAAMQRHLLTREPYRSYGVTLDELFREGSFRVHEDLYLLSDQVFGWDNDYLVLREAGIEGVRAHPGKYASGVVSTLWQQLSKAHYRLPPPATSAPRPAQTAAMDLPEPTEGEPIPAGQNVWISRPDNSIREVWTSPTEHRFVFEQPTQKPRFDEIQKELRELMSGLPDREDNGTLSRRLNQLSRWYPRPIHFVAIGLVALAIRRPRNAHVLIALPLAALLAVLVNAAGLFADLHFLLPFAPAFVLMGVAALLGPRAA